jgi:hypothetical protein
MHLDKRLNKVISPRMQGKSFVCRKVAKQYHCLSAIALEPFMPSHVVRNAQNEHMSARGKIYLEHMNRDLK